MNEEIIIEQSRESVFPQVLSHWFRMQTDMCLRTKKKWKISKGKNIPMICQNFTKSWFNFQAKNSHVLLTNCLLYSFRTYKFVVSCRALRLIFTRNQDFVWCQMFDLRTCGLKLKFQKSVKF